MALGLEVYKGNLDNKAAQAALELRNAFLKVESVTKWLANHPVIDAIDPLIAEFGYTVDEAYVLRYYFEGVDAMRLANQNLFDTGRKLTGLE